LRIGKLESSILSALEDYTERLKKDQTGEHRPIDWTPVEWGHGYHRDTYKKSGLVPTLWIRDQIFSADSKSITATQKSSFSRAIKNLKKSVLIESWNHYSEKQNYVTHVKLTDQGRIVLERIKQKRAKKNPNINFQTMMPW
jgi:hypothetical protein